MKIDLHYVGALFNPYLLGNNMIHDDVDAKGGIKWVLWKMLVNAISHVQVLINFANLVKGQGPFVNIPTTTSLNMPLHEWWDLIKASARIVKHIFPKSVQHHHVNEIRIHIPLCITRCKIASHLTKQQI